MTVATIKPHLVFGTIEANAACNRLVDFYEETVLKPDQLSLTCNSGQSISLNVEDIFLENKNDLSNKAKVTYLVSIPVESEDQDNAINEANIRLNEANTSFFSFNLTDYHSEEYCFNVIDSAINWNSFLHTDDI